MADRGARMFVLGLIIGGLAAAFLASGALTAWHWRTGGNIQSHVAIVPSVRPVQGVPNTKQIVPKEFNLPKEFVPVLPQRGQDQGPGVPPPGAGGQNCDKILYFFQGKLYQLRPGPMPRNGGNPEFYYMQPYEGPQIPGFPLPGPTTPGPMIPGMPDPNMGPVVPRRI
jgi:hypothetical protein